MDSRPDRSRKRRGKARPRPAKAGEVTSGPARTSWLWSKRPVLQFVLLLGLLMALFYAATLAPIFQRHIFPAYLKLNTQGSAAILRLLGDDARAVETRLVSSRFAVEIRRGCDAIEPSALFAAAVLAFPARWRLRLLGALVGVVILAILNFVRILTLYYVGVYAPKVFETMHMDVWQPAFIALALVLWVVWALWATRPKRPRPHAAG